MGSAFCPLGAFFADSPPFFTGLAEWWGMRGKTGGLVLLFLCGEGGIWGIFYGLAGMGNGWFFVVTVYI